MTRPLLTVNAFLLILISCDHDGQDSKGNAFKASPPVNAEMKQRISKGIFPFDRVITDDKKRKLEVIVVGRTRDEIIFQKKNSNTPNKHHRYPISSLSIRDQQFFKSLPRQQWNGGGGTIVEGLIRERNRIAELITDKKKEKSSTPEAKTRIRSLDREISRLEGMLTETKLKIKEQQAKDAQGS